MSKAVSIGAAGFFGMLAMGVVLRLGSETLAVVVGVLLGVMGIIPLGVLLLAAVGSGREAQCQAPPVVIPPSGRRALMAGDTSPHEVTVLPSKGATAALPVAPKHLLSDGR